MEFSEDNYSLEEDDNFQPTLLETNAESIKEIPLKATYKKWINSQSEISTISNIIYLEMDTSNEKYSQNLENKDKEINNDAKEKNDKINNDKDKLEEKKEEINNKINNYTFIWNGEAKNVKITGTFSDWKIKYDMIKDPNNNFFKIELPLDSQIYQFKFIVDNEWKYSPNYQTQKDNLGNINNTIDLTNFFQKDGEININTKEKLEIKEKESEEKTNDSKSPNKIKKRKESIYDCEYPSDDNIIPLSLPNKRYYQSFKLDKYSHQNSIGNEKYYSYKERPSFSYEASSKPIFLLGHINLNHLISFKNQKMITTKNCMSFRYREKACTILYYK